MVTGPVEGSVRRVEDTPSATHIIPVDDELMLAGVLDQHHHFY